MFACGLICSDCIIANFHVNASQEPNEDQDTDRNWFFTSEESNKILDFQFTKHSFAREIIIIY